MIIKFGDRRVNSKHLVFYEPCQWEDSRNEKGTIYGILYRDTSDTCRFDFDSEKERDDFLKELDQKFELVEREKEVDSSMRKSMRKLLKGQEVKTEQENPLKELVKIALEEIERNKAQALRDNLNKAWTTQVPMSGVQFINLPSISPHSLRPNIPVEGTTTYTQSGASSNMRDMNEEASNDITTAGDQDTDSF